MTDNLRQNKWCAQIRIRKMCYKQHANPRVRILCSFVSPQLISYIDNTCITLYRLAACWNRLSGVETSISPDDVTTGTIGATATLPDEWLSGSAGDSEDSMWC